MKNEHVKDAAQGAAEGVAGDVPQDVAQELTFGARTAYTAHTFKYITNPNSPKLIDRPPGGSPT